VSEFLTYTILGLVTGSLYAVAASGLVVTYTTSGIFNFAHGAFGMLAAFMYWQLKEAWGWPTPLALAVVVFVGAPLFGALVERVIIRGLKNVSEVTKLIVSVSLLFGVFQGANVLFPTAGRRFPTFFEGHFIDLGVYRMPVYEAVIIAAAVLTALGLRFLLFNTRAGVTMRAVVDDRELTLLNGGQPGRSAMTSWAVGAMLAAVAGILFASTQGSLSQVPLTLLVVNAYGAALFGRLKSLPMTFAGALALGLAQSYALGYLPLDKTVASIAGVAIDPALSLRGLRSAIPIIALFLVLYFLPPLRVKAGAQLASREVVPSPSWFRWLGLTAVLAGAAALIGATASQGITYQLGQGIALGIVMLSLVPLIGYGGQISLAPMAFAGVGAIAMGTWGGDGSVWGLVIAVALSAFVGALVALPVIRLQGLYLALATAAFAVLMDQLVFSQDTFLPNGNLGVPRLSIGSLHFTSDRSHLILLTVVFGLIASGIAMMRSRPFGRRLLAMKSSDAACATLGVNLASTKLAVFMLSAGIAGLGGALYGAQLNSIGTTTFQFLQGLPVVLLAVIGGIGSPAGALIGGVLYSLSFLILPEQFPALSDLLLMSPALVGISLGRDPNGIVNQLAVARRRAKSRAAAATAEVRTDGRELSEAERYSASRLLLDEELGLTAEQEYATLRTLTATRGSV
jgi:branched-chain amino acid transport system permease protein